MQAAYKVLHEIDSDIEGFLYLRSVTTSVHYAISTVASGPLLRTPRVFLLLKYVRQANATLACASSSPAALSDLPVHQAAKTYGGSR
jgi:hypothetical protein